ncbi:hypothetical protein [Syntrophomonas curvata]
MEESRIRWLTGLTVLCVFLFILPSGVFASSTITLDGQFDDWEGQASIADPAYDSNPSGDILKFYWATNDDDSNLYFMIERRGWGNIDDPLPTVYRLNLDLSDNGIYHNGNDRYLLIHYHPFLDGLVSIDLYKGNGKYMKSYSGEWGECTPRGGRKCEFGVSMDDLHMFPAQSIRMYVQSYNLINDRCPDNGDIQWSPIPIMPLWALIAIFTAVLLAGTYIIRKRMKA